jgi:hypothetical protein
MRKVALTPAASINYTSYQPNSPHRTGHRLTIAKQKHNNNTLFLLGESVNKGFGTFPAGTSPFASLSLSTFPSVLSAGSPFSFRL